MHDPPPPPFRFCLLPTPQPQAPAAHKHKGKNGDSSDNLDSSDDEANASCDETLFHQKPPRQLLQPTEDEDDDSQSQDLLAEDAALLTSIAKRGQDEAHKEWNPDMELRAGNDGHSHPPIRTPVPKHQIRHGYAPAPSPWKTRSSKKG